MLIYVEVLAHHAPDREQAVRWAVARAEARAAQETGAPVRVVSVSATLLQGDWAVIVLVEPTVSSVTEGTDG